MIGRILHKRSLFRFWDEMMAVCMHDNLSFRDLYTKETAVTLVGQWRIDDTFSLIQTMKWLLQEGTRAEFERTRHFLSAFTDSERKSFIQSLTDNNPSHRKLSITEHYGERLPLDGIAAFDYSWCVILATVGTTLNILDMESSDAYATQAAVKAQSAYAGWAEYTFAYTVGAEFSGRFPLDVAKRHESYYLHLRQAWQLPFNRVNWNMRLRYT